jgi:hypothetical protein
MIRFFILNQYSAWFDPPIVGKPGAFELDPLPIVASGTVLELTGWALDGQGRPFASVAARIDEHPWNQGWTGVQRSDYGPAAVPKTASTGFQARIRLDTIAAGLHRVRLAGMTLDGKWRALGDSRRLIVTHPRAPLPPWAHPLVDGGEAEITDVDGNRLSRIDVYRLGSAVSFEGSLRRVTPVGKTVSLVAHNGETELHFPTWSAPTPNPKAVLFGGEIPPRALAPAAYRLFVDAPDASQRYVGRADTRCDLVVQRADPPRL